MNLEMLRRLSGERFEELCRYLLPGGHKEGHRWLAGSSRGEPGHSFDVNLHTGLFGDWAAGDNMQRGAVDLWMKVRNVDLKIATRELSAWLGCCPESHSSKHPETGNGTREAVFFPPGLCKPTRKDFQALSRSRSINVEALHIAAERGFVWCFDDELNGRCWLFTDQLRRCALRRR